MSDRLHKQIAEVIDVVETARRRGAPLWPMNEADTERLVIEPVLKALGYGPLDYRKRMQGAGADYPDYIILPGSEQQWVLEAKEWDTKLDVRYERQTVNYANNNGAQWAVLTNGCAWWVYNTRAPGDLTQQRIYEIADIHDAEAAVQVLAYLSRESVQQGGIDKAYRAREIRSAVAAAVGGNKRVIRAIRDVVGSSLDRHVTDDEIAEAVAALTGPPVAPVAVLQPAL